MRSLSSFLDATRISRSRTEPASLEKNPSTSEIELGAVLGREGKFEAIGRLFYAWRRHWLTVEWLPKYAPELNDIEPV